MSTSEKEPYNALIIASDHDRRKRLRSALHGDQYLGRPTYKKIRITRDFREASELLMGDPHFDVVLIEDSLAGAKLDNFLGSIEAICEAVLGIVLVYKSNAADKISIAVDTIGGTDAFLFEPYTLDMLRMVASIAEEARSVNKERRVLFAAELVIESALDEIDHRARCLLEGSKDRGFPKHLVEAFNVFDDVSSTTKKEFYKRIESATEKRKPFVMQDYGGASKRVNQKLEEERRAQEDIAAVRDQFIIIRR